MTTSFSPKRTPRRRISGMGAGMVALLAMLVLAGTAFAESAGYGPKPSSLRIDSDVGPRQVPLGAEIEWFTIIDHPRNSRVGFAAPYTGGTLAVKSTEVRPERTGQTSIRIVLAGFELGETALPPMQLRLTDDEGNDQPFMVGGETVEILGMDRDQPAGLAPLVSIEEWNPTFFGGLGILALLLGGFIYWLRRRPASPSVEAPVDPRTATQIALDAIVELQSQQLLERDEVKAFTYALDDIMRQFLITLYGRGELSQTSEEFLRTVDLVLPRSQRERVHGFFARGDQVRFAGEEHRVEEARELCREAIALIGQLGGGTAEAPQTHDSPKATAAEDSGGPETGGDGDR